MMGPSSLLLGFVFCFSSPGVQGDIFSSTSHLSNLMYLERHLVTNMYEYIDDMEQRIAQVKRYVEEFSGALKPEEASLESDEDIVGNPLHAFQLIKRLTINFNQISSVMKESSWSKIERLATEYKTVMPKEEDLHGAALALIRLQDTYNLNMTDMADGKIRGTPTSIYMNARDCLYLGKHSFNNGYYGQALEWFEESLRKAHSERNSTAPVDEILPFYNMAVNIYDSMLPTYKETLEPSISSPIPARMRFLDGDNDEFRNYQSLCRGDNIKTPKEEAKLKCYYSDRGNPYLTLSPIKVEEFHHYPIFIVMFHDILTDAETEAIKDMAAPQLQRAKVQTDMNLTNEVSGTRTSQTAWFSEDHEIVGRVTRRVADVTGLSTDMTESHSELMQVANYGMGGHYIPHYDYLIVDRPPSERHLVDEKEVYAGDRTATLMFYLSDVKKGGGTVFPRIGVRLTPKKNAAAFWFNLKRNGEAIEDTVHGACPVLMGEKWVANHWMRENGQMFRRKCTLDPEE